MQETTGHTELNLTAALDKYADMVRRICFLYLKNREDVEDIFQDVFLKYLERTEPFAGDEHEKAWLLRVAINNSKNLLSSFWHNRVLPLDEEIAAAVPAESHEVLQEILALPAKERLAIYLFYYEGYSADEIARLQHRKINTIYSYLHRGRKRLAAKLGGIENETDD